MLAALLLPSVISARSFENNDVSRTYSLQGGIIGVIAKISASNVGGAPLSKYRFQLSPREAKDVNVITASTNQKIIFDPTNSLPIHRIEPDTYEIELPNPIQAGSSFSIVVSYTLGLHLLFVRPTVVLNEKFSLFFNTSYGFVSPYPTRTTSVRIDGIQKSAIQHISDHPAVQIKSIYIVVGPLPGDEAGDFEVEFQSPLPIPYISHVDSLTTVSHWGKSKQRVYMEVRNEGPKFIGEFNRIDFTQSSPCYISSIPVQPPKTAYDFWAGDESGLLQKDLSIHDEKLEIPLRGPMLGGWKATFTVGWTMETSSLINGKYTLEAPLLPQLVSSSIGSIVSTFALPEGAVVDSVNVPIEANTTTSPLLSNLDINGRTAVRIEASKLSSIDNIKVTIKYHIYPNWMFAKLGVLMGGLAVLFVAIIIIRRIDLSLGVGEVVKVKAE